MSRTHTDLSIVAVSVAPSPATSGTSIGVTDANAAYLPDVYPWYALIKPASSMPTRSNGEIVQVTAGSSSGGTTTYTIVRAQGVPVTTARSIIVGDEILEVHAAQHQANIDATQNSSMSRQALINGNFDVWQRGTTVTNPASTTYLADRWKFDVGADGGTLPNITYSRQTLTAGDIPNSFYYFRYAPDGAGTSLGNNAVVNIHQWIENGVRFLCGNGKKVTVSFWARSSIANKTIGLTMIQNYGSGGSPTAQETLTGGVFSLTSSWQKFSITLTTNTLVGKTFGTNNDDGLRPFFSIYWGSTRNSNYGGTATTNLASGTIDIAQVQLCAGDVALPFQPKSFEEELRACQRYYEKSYDIATNPGTNTSLGTEILVIGDNTTTANKQTTVTFRVTKRAAAPTIVLYDVAGNSAKVTTVDATGVETNNVAGASANSSQRNFLVYDTTSGEAGFKFHWTAESEI